MIDVTCAVIRNEDNEILVVQRGKETDHPFKWEFPGGKLHPGESEEECIIREVREELSMDLIIFRRLADVRYDYGHKEIRLIPFICDTLDELPFLSEHIAYKWVSERALLSIDFSEADLLVADSYLQTLVPSKNPQPGNLHQPSTEAINDEELQSMITRMISMKEANWIAVSAIENPVILLKLLEYSYSPDNKLAFHASWALTKVCDKYPEIIDPYLPGMVDSLGKIENESTKRSFLRIISLSNMKSITPHHHGLLADFCFASLNSAISAIAIKAYSIEILYRLTLIYPDLATELAVSIRNLFDEGSSGVIARGIIILKKLNK